MKAFYILLAAGLSLFSACVPDPDPDPTPGTYYYIDFEDGIRDVYAPVGDSLYIPAEVTVYDRTGGGYNPVPGIAVSFRIDNGLAEVSPTIAISDSQGIARTTVLAEAFRGDHSVSLSARIGNNYQNNYFSIIGVRPPQRLEFATSTHRMVASPGVSARLKIAGTISDSLGVGIGRLKLEGSIVSTIGGDPFGSITLDSTNESDGSFAVFFSSNGGYGEEGIQITASVPGNGHISITRTFELEVARLDADVGSLEFHLPPTELNLPVEGESTVTIEAAALDDAGRPISGLTVQFWTTKGLIEPSAVTDSLGVAAVAWRIGRDPGEAIITAMVGADEITAVTRVRLIQQPAHARPIAEIELYADDYGAIAGSGQNITIYARCLAEDGYFASPGEVVHFDLDGEGLLRGDFGIVNQDGYAYTNFEVGDEFGISDITAWSVVEGEEMVRSNRIDIRAIAGEPDRLVLSTDRLELYLDQPETANITASVTDDYGNPVEGELVNFTASIGSITPTALTDEEGRAVASFVPTNESGTALIEASTDHLETSIEIRIGAAIPNSIELTADPLDLIDYGFVNRPTSTLSAYVKGFNGGPVLTPQTVIFEMLNQDPRPNGAGFSNSDQIDSTRTNNGVAIIAVRGGFQVGPIIIKAYTWSDSLRHDTLSVIFDQLRLLGGPPSMIDIDIDERGTDEGGGTWGIEVSARVSDANLNPAQPGIPVSFFVDPDDICTIDPARTDERGMATTTLRYHSLATFSHFTIRAEIEMANGTIEDELPWTLPLQQGHITLAADPGNWMFDREEPLDTCQIQVWATLRDGHDVLINNGPIVFTTERARFYWRDQIGNRMRRFFPDPARKLTGVRNQNHNEDPGVATVYLRGVMDDFFLDEFANEASVQIRAHVDGMEIAADPVFIRMTR